MIDNLEYEISEFLKKQPNMILEREETRYIIKGRYICTLDSRGYIVDVNKKIKIVFSVLLMTAFIFNSQKVLGESKKTVSILFTHDMHSHIDVERNVKDGKERESGGLAKVKTVKDRTEDRYSGTFLVDAGDFAMGTPFQTVFRERASELKTMAEVGFDATTLGNH